MRMVSRDVYLQVYIAAVAEIHVASLFPKARQLGGITHDRTCLDQPNRRIRTRLYGGVGGRSCEAPSYPDVCWVRHMFLRVRRTYHGNDEWYGSNHSVFRSPGPDFLP